MRIANRRAWLADFWHGDRKWFTVGDASRGEVERGDTRSSNGEVCGGGVLDSLQSHSLPSLFLSRWTSSFFSPCNIWSLPLSLSPFLSPHRGSRLKTRSKSRRRVASSRFGDSKEGSLLFLTLYRRLYLCRDARVLRLYFASSHDGVARANVIRRETPGPISRTLAVFWTRGLFGSRVRAVLFHTAGLISFLPFFLSLQSISLAIVHLTTFSPCGLQRAESELSRFPLRLPCAHSVFPTRRNRNTAHDSQRSEISAGFRMRIASCNNNFCWYWISLKEFSSVSGLVILLNIVLNLSTKNVMY